MRIFLFPVNGDVIQQWTVFVNENLGINFICDRFAPSVVDLGLSSHFFIIFMDIVSYNRKFPERFVAFLLDLL